MTAVRVSGVTDFDRRFETATGVLRLRVYNLGAGEDPLDPDQGTLDPNPVAYTVRRYR